MRHTDIGFENLISLRGRPTAVSAMTCTVNCRVNSNTGSFRLFKAAFETNVLVIAHVEWKRIVKAIRNLISFDILRRQQETKQRKSSNAATESRHSVDLLSSFYLHDGQGLVEDILPGTVLY